MSQQVSICITAVQIPKNEPNKTQNQDGGILGDARGCIPFLPFDGFCMHLCILGLGPINPEPGWSLYEPPPSVCISQSFSASKALSISAGTQNHAGERANQGQPQHTLQRGKQHQAANPLACPPVLMSPCLVSGKGAKGGTIIQNV